MFYDAPLESDSFRVRSRWPGGVEDAMLETVGKRWGMVVGWMISFDRHAIRQVGHCGCVLALGY
jgi:hypothetical protein